MPGRLAHFALVVPIVAIIVVGLSTTNADALPPIPTACQPTTLFRDHFLTAKIVNLSLVDQDVNASDDFSGAPCDIGAYYDQPGPFSITNSSVHGAIYFGIIARGVATLDVTDS